LPIAGATVVGLLGSVGVAVALGSATSSAIQESRRGGTESSLAGPLSALILSSVAVACLTALTPPLIYRFAVDTHDMAGPPAKKPRGKSPLRALEAELDRGAS
jgi:hypothetical protein